MATRKKPKKTVDLNGYKFEVGTLYHWNAIFTFTPEMTFSAQQSLVNMHNDTASGYKLALGDPKNAIERTIVEDLIPFRLCTVEWNDALYLAATEEFQWLTKPRTAHEKRVYRTEKRWTGLPRLLPYDVAFTIEED